jgi:hypothetical protein
MSWAKVDSVPRLYEPPRRKPDIEAEFYGSKLGVPYAPRDIIPIEEYRR